MYTIIKLNKSKQNIVNHFASLQIRIEKANCQALIFLEYDKKCTKFFLGYQFKCDIDEENRHVCIHQYIIYLYIKMTRELENNTIINNINIPLKRKQKITKCKQLWFLQENIITVSFFLSK